MNVSSELKEASRLDTLLASMPFGHADAGIAFEPITANRMRTVTRIEQQAFPEHFRAFGWGGIRAMLSRPGADRFSFLVTQPKERATSRALGYCVARYSQRESGIVTDRVHVESLAIAPSCQGKQLGFFALAELLQRAEANNVGAVSFYLRSSTSYPAIMNHRPLIEETGFHVTEVAGAQVQDRLGESQHHVVLHKEPLDFASKFAIPHKAF